MLDATVIPSDRRTLARSAVYRRMAILRAEIEDTGGAMVRLAEEFRLSCPDSPVHMVVQRLADGAAYTRWRQGGNKRGYVVPERVAELAWFRSMDAAAQRRHLRFARRMLDLNLIHALHLGELKRLQRYLCQLAALRHVQRLEA